eukprot:TRINITY_DN69952_c0_g1_i1.p1 TRINITY_DN69952_c0_g1~~TRINITY_DN69952_c0_g1_i1.p1  ORF type:complete len:124 (+),score=25.41 TRINITY_DN69952_c0_g1_i1:56-427(+)
MAVLRVITVVVACAAATSGQGNVEGRWHAIVLDDQDYPAADETCMMQQLRGGEKVEAKHLQKHRQGEDELLDDRRLLAASGQAASPDCAYCTCQGDGTNCQCPAEPLQGMQGSCSNGCCMLQG